MQKHQSILEGKKVVIIGGSAGIGLAAAIAAANSGALVIIASSDAERMEKALSQLPENASGICTDAGDEEQIKRLFEQTGFFDHLIYTAGETFYSGILSEIDIKSSKKFFDIRYWGAMAAVKYAAPYINPGGSITLTSGIAGQSPGKGWAIGASMTAAMEGFTRAMAIELAPIRVNAVSPGIVNTELWSLVPPEAREHLFSQAASQLPLGKIAGPQDLALTYLHLMEQNYMTGQTITVDGGGVLTNIYGRLQG
ncbi:SDR family oxidoreductase [Mucilaginibacter jinjuensis]|uniref:SDR family oxidoreductase n=1 Tax=Mucilaginibacter jinjuensis TaxID=1176721 RepID=A0ABY7TCS8_9SPHI|nr:SDR family oxidoreductase [Mucilaginibacter jinjuensis]WCT14315.1 SDR family oxidoreductase [Mucilaginibacter jinjuensis]